MQDKLQELTSQLYNEGLAKGRKEGEVIVNNARLEAEKIISSAKKEAERIIEESRKNASELGSKTESDVKMAARECICATKQEVEKLIIAKVAGEKIDKTLADSGFMKEILKSVVEKFSTSEPCELELLLPESMKESLEPYVISELSKVTEKGISANFSKKISGGFTIGPKNGSYFISLTDDTFKELIAEYLRPATRKLLFGE